LGTIGKIKEKCKKREEVRKGMISQVIIWNLADEGKGIKHSCLMNTKTNSNGVIHSL
jgi:hypothetical protein